MKTMSKLAEPGCEESEEETQIPWEILELARMNEERLGKKAYDARSASSTSKRMLLLLLLLRK